MKINCKLFSLQPFTSISACVLSLCFNAIIREVDAIRSSSSLSQSEMLAITASGLFDLKAFIMLSLG